jgi:hypothetical protein
LYFAGAQLCHTFPVSVVADGQGLNITVASYLDRLDFGFIVDRELVPDVWDLADMHVDEIERLFAARGAEWAEPPQPADPRRGPVKAGFGDGSDGMLIRQHGGRVQGDRDVRRAELRALLRDSTRSDDAAAAGRL